MISTECKPILYVPLHPTLCVPVCVIACEAKEDQCTEPKCLGPRPKPREFDLIKCFSHPLTLRQPKQTTKQKSMHWVTPKTKDRMLPETGGAAAQGPGTGAGCSSGGLTAASPNPAHRRASEGGAALYYGSRKGEWGGENTDVANKFRNYEI